jgi:hypothetical protein
MYRFYENLTKDKGGGGGFAMYLETHLKAKVLKGGLAKDFMETSRQSFYRTC